jgi:flavin-dependent dehydrogenase
MKGASAVHDWLAVSVEGFGARNLNPAPNLFSIGDAAAFIDPFTGSGMLMALESAEIMWRVVAENRFATENAADVYKNLYKRKFQARLRICSLVRRAAFVPNLAKYAISVLGFSEKAREMLARSTRREMPPKKIKS